MAKHFRICPICNSVLNVRENQLYCISCDETFTFDGKHNVWRNHAIMDIAYTDPSSAVLSIPFPLKFTLETSSGKKTFNSVAAFLLAICWPGSDDTGLVDELASLHGVDALKARSIMPSWQETQCVTWNRKVIKRDSEEYKELLRMVYDRLFEQSQIFRMALIKSKGKIFMNVSGEKDKSKTLITPNELIGLLQRERNKLMI